MKEQIGILRRCSVCEKWRSIDVFRGRLHECRDCRGRTIYRSIVLTDKGKEAARLLRGGKPAAA